MYADLRVVHPSCYVADDIICIAEELKLNYLSDDGKCVSINLKRGDITRAAHLWFDMCDRGLIDHHLHKKLAMSRRATMGAYDGNTLRNVC